MSLLAKTSLVVLLLLILPHTEATSLRKRLLSGSMVDDVHSGDFPSKEEINADLDTRYEATSYISFKVLQWFWKSKAAD